jgi:hypothetical protein
VSGIISRIIAAALLTVGPWCAAQGDNLLGVDAGKGKAPPFQVLHHANGANGGAGASKAVTINGTTAGNFIIVGIGWCADVNCGFPASVSVSTVTSSAGETCSQVPNANGGATPSLKTDIWYCPNIHGGNDTITVTTTSSQASYLSVFLSEWTGITNVSPLDGIASNTGGSFNTNSFTSCSVQTNGVTTQAGELIYSVLFGGNNPIRGYQPQVDTFTSYLISGAISNAYTHFYYWLNAAAKSCGISIAAFKHP